MLFLRSFAHRCQKSIGDVFIKQHLNTVLTALALGVLFYFGVPHVAFAWDPQNAVTSVLNFVKLLILLGAAATAVVMVFRSQIIPAAIVVLAAAFFYVILSPEIMQAIGEGLKKIFGL